ncbi:MAG: hypothetical protein ACXWLH_05130, partial [Candidatus Saccharimonadales bacterium]
HMVIAQSYAAGESFSSTATGDVRNDYVDIAEFGSKKVITLIGASVLRSPFDLLVVRVGGYTLAVDKINASSQIVVDKVEDLADLNREFCERLADDRQETLDVGIPTIDAKRGITDMAWLYRPISKNENVQQSAILRPAIGSNRYDLGARLHTQSLLKLFIPDMQLDLEV